MKEKNNSIIVIVLTLFLITACGSSNECLVQENLKLEYYTAGGFSNISNGLTLFTDGKVKFWEGYPPDERNAKDSLIISKEKRCRIDSLLTNSDWQSYQNDFAGNLTGYLSIQTEGSQNKFSFDPFSIPPDMPESLKMLIKELRAINNK